jgi:hypothetical protein
MEVDNNFNADGFHRFQLALMGELEIPLGGQRKQLFNQINK